MPVIAVRHKTVYRYASPVTFREHRLMIRPRDSHDLRLIRTALTIRPAASVSWFHDVFGNSIAVARFSEAGSELLIDSSFEAEHFTTSESEIREARFARTYPVRYSADEMTDLAPALMRGSLDPAGKVDLWAHWFVTQGRGVDVLDILVGITRSIQFQFAYVRRDEMGTQSAVDTLESRSGNCRDFALFMMEAVRSLGFAAQFVSGYLHDRTAGNASAHPIGGATTHAWVQVYVPGAGWIEFDPTNGLVGGENLVRVAVVRDPAQAVPVSGSYVGRSTDFLGMSVDVSVTAGSIA